MKLQSTLESGDTFTYINKTPSKPYVLKLSNLESGDVFTYLPCKKSPPYVLGQVNEPCQFSVSEFLLFDWTALEASAELLATRMREKQLPQSSVRPVSHPVVSMLSKALAYLRAAFQKLRV
jgi:hypothetical protein